MNNQFMSMEGFGERISMLRKNKKMTQEELADKLGITSQAVSKWENGICYPDITLVPMLSELLGLSVDTLFGKQNNASAVPKFPKYYRDLHFVHSYKNIGCYSDKQFVERTETKVTFLDQSTADLAGRSVENIGTGEIVLYEADEYEAEEYDPSKTTAEFSFDNVKSLMVRTVTCKYDITQGNEKTTYVKAKGSSRFIKEFSASASGGVLECKEKNENNNNNYDKRDVNTVEIILGTGAMEELNVSINGSGNVNNNVYFEKLNLKINGSGNIRNDNDTVDTDIKINGSGDIKLNDCKQFFKVKINGSGDVEAGDCVGTDIYINGSGDVTIQKIGGNFKSKINGSGDIDIKSGSVDHFHAEIVGSGDIKAENVTAITAEIKILSSGTVVLGRVIERSIEKALSKRSVIRILKRGLQ